MARTRAEQGLKRRMSSRGIVLSAAFLALAAGGTAACDAGGYGDDEFADAGSEWESDRYSGPGSGYGSDSAGSDSAGSDSAGSDSGSGSDSAGSDADSGSEPESDLSADPVGSESGEDEVFYCADEEGEIVDEDMCADGGTSSYFLWHSASYARGLGPGTYLDGGDYFPPGDRAARRAFKLPATGKVSNGTVKTNVVGRSSDGGSTLSSGTSGG